MTPHPDKLPEGEAGVPATVLPPSQSEPPFVPLTTKSRPWKEWLLWITDMTTEFVDGFVDGITGVGLVVGTGYSTQAPTSRLTDILDYGTAGALWTGIAAGLLAVRTWKRAGNKMPNPFRRNAK